uniref:NAD(P)/FAD-dependent oxidoreductase n=1 Tax=Prevotella sp. GTC17253 TaxID=3236793 RepID=A0AB33IL99_9BACT
MKIAIVGGGAAGFFAAITAKSRHPEADVCILERASQVLAKVGVSGGGRCNLTNSFEDVTDLKQVYPRGHKLMKRLFKSFNERDAYEWFEAHGVKLVTQADHCVFPQSQRSQSIIDCLVNEAHRLGIHILTRHEVKNIVPQTNGQLSLALADKQMTADRVAITTGGSPHGKGLAYLEALGHSIETPVPSLFTFNIADKSLRQLMGTVVIDAIVQMPGTKFRTSGPLLITHWGMSGPAILKLSSHAARYLAEHEYRLPVAVNWTGCTNNSDVQTQLTELALRHAQKQLGTIPPFQLPSRLWQFIIERANLSTEKKWAEVGKKGLNKLVETLVNDQYNINGKGAFKEEFVTCGGIALSNVNLNTLESKVCPHLFFAGEVLDIDAITGGFNLQAAWTTGYTVGQSIAD